MPAAAGESRQSVGKSVGKAKIGSDCEANRDTNKLALAQMYLWFRMAARRGEQRQCRGAPLPELPPDRVGEIVAAESNLATVLPDLTVVLTGSVEP
jgi:hypothetical protein